MTIRRLFPLRGAVVLMLAALAACDAPTTHPLTRAEGPARANAAPVLTVTNSGGHPLISWAALAGATSYSVTLFVTVTKSNKATGESTSQRYDYPLGSTTGTSYLDTSNAYLGQSLCSYNNYPIVTRELWRYQVTATFPTGTTSSTVAAPVNQC